MAPFHKFKSNGPQPLCRECGREEVAGGDLCHGCRQRLRYQKKSAAEHLKACHEIAERLYEEGKRRKAKGENKENKFEDVFSWINTQVKKRRSLVLVLHSLERLDSMANGAESKIQNPKSKIEGPRGDVWAYLEGTLRRLEEKSEAQKFRRSGVTRIGDIPMNLRDLARMKDPK